MGGAALLVVGYAFYVLVSPLPERAPAEGDASERGSQAARGEAKAPRGGGARDAKRRGPTTPTRIVDPDRPNAPPPPRPTPSLPLAEARKQFADFMAELDGLAARDVELTSPEWVELYRRGHEVLLPLQQSLDHQVPEQARELQMANEDMRAKLNAIDPNRPDPPPSPQ